MGEIASYEANGTAATADRPMSITLEEAFDALNQRLWEGRLQPLVLLIHRSLRTTTGGYYSPGRWRFRGDETMEATEQQMAERDKELWKGNCAEAGNFLGNPNGWERAEIALNPESWPYHSDRFILSILAHEMAHHWQQLFGKKPPRRGYHNREWGSEMKRIGLHPSNTGEPGGDETGVQMTHFIVEGGPFDLACRELLDGGVRIAWEAPRPQRGIRPKSKVKYTCPCGKNAWAKPNAKLVCGECGDSMLSEEGDD